MQQVSAICKCFQSICRIQWGLELLMEFQSSRATPKVCRIVYNQPSPLVALHCSQIASATCLLEAMLSSAFQVHELDPACRPALLLICRLSSCSSVPHPTRDSNLEGQASWQPGAQGPSKQVQVSFGSSWVQHFKARSCLPVDQVVLSNTVAENGFHDRVA